MLFQTNDFMNRIAFKMHLNPGQKNEYIKRHKALWPELQELLKKSGIEEYSIFLDEDTNTLFAFQKCKKGEDSQNLKGEEIVQKWWKYMADIMVVNVDNSPKSMALEEVFYMK